MMGCYSPKLILSVMIRIHTGKIILHLLENIFSFFRQKEKEDIELFADATLRVREKNKKKKRKEKALQRAILSV